MGGGSFQRLIQYLSFNQESHSEDLSARPLGTGAPKPTRQRLIIFW